MCRAGANRPGCGRRRHKHPRRAESHSVQLDQMTEVRLCDTTWQCETSDAESTLRPCQALVERVGEVARRQPRRAMKIEEMRP
eukprot:1410297-Prymnesium_polylepis.1